jgi:hypothetical protein
VAQPAHGAFDGFPNDTGRSYRAGLKCWRWISITRPKQVGLGLTAAFLHWCDTTTNTLRMRVLGWERLAMEVDHVH